MRISLAEAVWTEIPARPTVVVPVGSLEQHGPHLPLETDTVIAQAVSDALAEAMDEVVLVAPPISYGSSGEHQSFPGTSSIGGKALHGVVVELVRSIATWVGRTVFVNAHGGNSSTLGSAVALMVDERHEVAWVPCVTEGADLHAGITETSLMLHLRPGTVRTDMVEPGETRPLREILPLMMAGGIGAVSPNGVLGDPTGSTASRGEAEFNAIVADVTARVSEWRRDDHGMLRSRSGIRV